MDKNLPNIAERYKKYLFKGDFQRKDDYPTKDFDYIISVGTLMLGIGDSPFNLKKTLLLAIKAIKKDGEIRIYPIWKVHCNSKLKGIKQGRKRWESLLQELNKKQIIKYEFRPIDIKVAGYNKNVWLEEVLILKKV